MPYYPIAGKKEEKSHSPSLLALADAIAPNTPAALFTWTALFIALILFMAKVGYALEVKKLDRHERSKMLERNSLWVKREAFPPRQLGK